jgi:hypothetical protein
LRTNKRVLIIIAILLLSLTTATGVVFADIDYSQWDSQAGYPSDVKDTPLFTPVKFLIDKKVITGYPDGTFKPDNYITRAEIAVALTKVTNRTTDLDNMAAREIFSDLKGYDWARGYINTMVDAKVVKGMSESTFAPGKNISYAELITMLVRLKSGAASEVDTYGTWPNNYITYAQTYNLLGDVVVKDWNAPATRGDFAKLLYRVTPK